MVRLQHEIGPGGLLIANPIPETHALDAGAIETRINEAVKEAKAQGVGQKEVTPFLLRPDRRADRRAQPRGQYGAGQEQRRARRASGRRAGATLSVTRPNKVLVVGDVMIDLLVRPEGPLAIGSDRRAKIVACAGGSAANQAVWLAHFGVAVTFVGRVAARDWDALTSELRACGVDAQLAADDAQRDGPAHRAHRPLGRAQLPDRSRRQRLPLRRRHRRRP